MDNWKATDQDEYPPRGDAPLEERLRMLEAQVAEHRGAAGAGAAAPEQHFWHPGMPTPEAPSVARLATISEDLDAHREQLRNAEMSLVDKIADVDDERRRATVRLQKAWQSYRDEVDDRLRRRTWWTAVLLVLFALLVGGALFFAARHVAIAQQQLSSDLSEIREAMNRVPGPDPQFDHQSPELTDLSARLDALSDTVATLSETWQQTALITPPDANAQQAADARLAAEITQLETRQQLAAQELVALHQALNAAQVTDAGQQTAEAGTAAAEPGTDAGGNDEPRGATSGTEADEDGEDAAGTGTTDATTDNGSDTVAASRVQQGTLTVSDAPFALQLVSFRGRDSLMRFAEHEDLPSKIYFRQETYRGRPWFVMIHSLHESAEDAAAELSRLPEGLAEQVDPWIRALDEGSQLMVLEAPRTD